MEYLQQLLLLTNDLVDGEGLVVQEVGNGTLRPNRKVGHPIVFDEVLGNSLLAGSSGHFSDSQSAERVGLGYVEQVAAI